MDNQILEKLYQFIFYKEEKTDEFINAANFLIPLLIEILDKEKKDNGDIEVTLTYGWPTARLVIKEDTIEFHFSYQPFEYRELITDRELIEKIKQAI